MHDNLSLKKRKKEKKNIHASEIINYKINYFHYLMGLNIDEELSPSERD